MEYNASISEELMRNAEKARASLVPAKSEAKYKKEYDHFQIWLEKNHIQNNNINETVLLTYFQTLSESYSPNSLWTKWSMIKSMMTIHNNFKGQKFNELEAFLKRKGKGYEPKKSRVLTREEVIQFLNTAPDETYLLNKVILIMGYFGGCRCQELLDLKISNVEDRGEVMIVNIPESKTNIRKQFTIVEEKEFSALYFLRKYMSLRPSGPGRFFLSYREKRCTVQPVGKNTLGKIPSKIAYFLGLPYPEAYTGHCLRRSSATALVNAGASMTMLKRHGGWRSTSVAEGYLEDSVEGKNKRARMLAGISEESTSCTSTLTTNTISSDELVNSRNNFSGRFENCKFIFVNSLEGVKDS